MNTRNIRFRSNRVRDVLALYHEELDGLYGSGEVGVFVEMLFEAFLGWDRVRLMCSKEQTIDQSDLLRFHWALEDLKGYRPIQHIVGYVNFCGCRIGVGSDVLIPRPETEEMVNYIVEGGGRSVERVVDLCTGSGCIAIALKRAFPTAEVTAVEVSSTALEMAHHNAEENGAEIRFVQADLLAWQPSESDGCDAPGYDLIVSNPPYVRESERHAMQRNVLDHEPALALFVPDDDPLCFYRAIAAFASARLSPRGLLAIEINEAFATDTCKLLHRQGFRAEVHTDFRGKERFIVAVLDE